MDNNNYFAVDSWELGRLCHRHGGSPVGSLDCIEHIAHASPGLPGALFADCTHDNETPAQKRDPRGMLYVISLCYNIS